MMTLCQAEIISTSYVINSNRSFLLITSHFKKIGLISQWLSTGVKFYFFALRKCPQSSTVAVMSNKMVPNALVLKILKDDEKCNIWSSQVSFWRTLQRKHWQALQYRSGTANSNTVNSKFHLIRSFDQVLNTTPIFSMLKNTVNSNTVNSKFH